MGRRGKEKGKGAGAGGGQGIEALKAPLGAIRSTKLNFFSIFFFGIKGKDQKSLVANEKINKLLDCRQADAKRNSIFFIRVLTSAPEKKVKIFHTFCPTDFLALINH